MENKKCVRNSEVFLMSVGHVENCSGLAGLVAAFTVVKSCLEGDRKTMLWGCEQSERRVMSHVSKDSRGSQARTVINY